MTSHRDYASVTGNDLSNNSATQLIDELEKPNFYNFYN